MVDGCDLDINIYEENTYSDEEIQEINRLIYCDDLSNLDYDYDSDQDIFQEDILEANGWYLEDTIYGFTAGCKIIKELQ